MIGSSWRNGGVWRGFKLLCAFVAVILMAHGIFGANGLLTYLQKRRDYNTLHRHILRLKKENQALQKDVHGLKSDPATIERYAREDLQMAGRHETIYVLPRPSPGSRDTARAAQQPSRLPSQRP